MLALRRSQSSYYNKYTSVGVSSPPPYRTSSPLYDHSGVASALGLDMERYTHAYGTKASYGNFSKHSYGKRFEMGSMKNTNQRLSKQYARLDNGSYNDENHGAIAHMPQSTHDTAHTIKRTRALIVRRKSRAHHQEADRLANSLRERE